MDLFLSDENYRKASKVLKPIASSIDEENTYNKHLAMTIDGWPVELHGTLRSGLWRSVERELDNVQHSVFFDGNVRSTEFRNSKGCSVQVFLPRVKEDVVFVFSHILQHFFQEGIGLRQICDWCRLMWTYKDSLDVQALESRIRKMGVMTEWEAFYNLASRYLGMPDLDTSFLCRDSKYDKRADRIMEFVLETGNFGHNRNYSYQNKYLYLVYKAISLWRHITDTIRYMRIFPVDSIKVMWSKLKVGVEWVVKGK